MTRKRKRRGTEVEMIQTGERFCGMVDTRDKPRCKHARMIVGKTRGRNDSSPAGSSFPGTTSQEGGGNSSVEVTFTKGALPQISDPIPPTEPSFQKWPNRVRPTVEKKKENNKMRRGVDTHRTSLPIFPPSYRSVFSYYLYHVTPHHRFCSVASRMDDTSLVTPQVCAR